MRPILLGLALGGAELSLRAYGTFMALAWVTSLAVASAFASRRGLPWRRSLAVYGVALAAGIVGARVLDLFVAADFYAQDPARVWGLNFAGFSLYGGLVAATLTAIAIARAWRLPLWRLADSAVPGLVVGIVLMRTGCFLNGCCYGHVTAVPWGVTFPAGSYAWAQQMGQGTTGILGAMGGLVKPVHPTQLYEMAAAIVLGAIALLLMRGAGDAAPDPQPTDATGARTRRLPDGVGFLVFAMGFTAFRFANGLLRERQPVVTAPEWFYPAFYSGAILVLVVLLVLRLMRRGPERPSA